MLIPLIIAIWFGVRANQCGKSVIGWAFGGAVLSLVAATVFTNAVVLLFTGSLTGRVELNTYMAIRVIGAILTIGAMVFVARKFLPKDMEKEDHTRP
jgi:hypothetical protein